MAAITVLVTGGATWTPPSNSVGSNAKIVCLGPGDSGTAPIGCSRVGNGGSGGSAAVKNSFSIPSTTPINIQIGASGSSDTWFNSTGTVLAKGASSGSANVGDVTHTGGGGAAGQDSCSGTFGGGGGGAGAEAANGSSASGQTGGISGSGASGAGSEYTITAGGTAGAGGGGAGGSGGCSPSNGSPGNNYGGGGGGGFQAAGGGGAPGAIVIIYTPIAVTSVTQNKGTTLGSQSVVIAGTGFTGATSVTFGGSAATGVVVNSDIQITCTTPAHAAGAVNVVVTAPAGVGTGTNAYTYIVIDVVSVTPSSGPTSGGQSVSISGHGFTGATSATIGGVAITSFSVGSDNVITGVTGAHAAGIVNVIVNTPFGNATGTNLYTYFDPLITIYPEYPAAFMRKPRMVRY